MSDHDHLAGGREGAPSPSRDGMRGPTLPPPAFPPGARRTAVRRNLQHDDLRDAFLSEEDPQVGLHSDAFFSPDDPFPPRLSGEGDPGIDEAGGEDFGPDDVVVTGIGDDPHLDPLEIGPGGDPYVMELAEQVGKLAEAIRRRGEAGLQTLPGMTTFEGTLRAYCVGYLRGRRTADEQG